MTIKEINQREADGVTVTLYAHFEFDECVEISCHVIDSRAGDDFVISDIPKHKASEIFAHPYACGRALLTGGALPVTENTILLAEDDS